MLAKFEHMKKYFGATKAVDDISIQIEEGEIRAIVGENGSGKSTLLSMIAGILKPDEGHMEVEGKNYHPHSQSDANRLGVSMIVQEINTLPGLTVAENIFLGRESEYSKGFFRDLKKLNQLAKDKLETAGLHSINPADDVTRYSLEQRKMIELVRAADIAPKILMVDETTTALSQTGREELYKLMKATKNRGSSVLFISHDLKEVLQISDTITVMRDGKYIDTVKSNEMTEDSLKRLMVGRELSGHYYREDYDTKISDEVVLEVKDLNCPSHFKNVNFQLHRGEILGFGGLSEAGMHEVARALYGTEYDVTGQILVNGKAVHTIKDRLDEKLGYISKNRDMESLFNQASIRDNICITCMEKLAPRFLVTKGKMTQFSERQADILHVKMEDVNQLVGALSGGNKQKVALSKWLACDTEIFVMDSPTRGIDVGVKAVIYSLMEELKKQGKSMIIVSEELLELIGMADRILIFKDGEVSGEIYRSPDLSEEQLVQEMI